MIWTLILILSIAGTFTGTAATVAYGVQIISFERLLLPICMCITSLLTTLILGSLAILILTHGTV